MTGGGMEIHMPADAAPIPAEPRPVSTDTMPLYQKNGICKEGTGENFAKSPPAPPREG